MINKTLWLNLIALAMVSCSPENPESDNIRVDPVSSQINAKIAANDPANPLNSYDLAGQVYSELLLAYVNNHTATTLPVIVLQIEALAAANSNFTYLNQNPYNTITQTQQDIITTGNIDVTLNASSLSPRAKASLQDFLDLLLAAGYESQNYNTVFTGIINYEAAISADGGLSMNDKKIILTATSIARYATAQDKSKGKDKDWRLSKNNLAAAAAGAAESTSKAVTLSLAAIIYNPDL